MIWISEDMRQHIVVEISNGKSQRGVVRKLNIGQTTVRNIWKRFMDTGITNDKPKLGRPMKTIARFISYEKFIKR